MTSNDLDEGLKSKGSLFIRNRDKDGKQLLVFDVKKHVKGVIPMDEMQKVFLYFLERIDRENEDGMVTIVFDCQGLYFSAINETNLSKLRISKLFRLWIEKYGYGIHTVHDRRTQRLLSSSAELYSRFGHAMGLERYTYSRFFSTITLNINSFQLPGKLSKPGYLQLA